MSGTLNAIDRLLSLQGDKTAGGFASGNPFEVNKDTTQNILQFADTIRREKQDKIDKIETAMAKYLDEALKVKNSSDIYSGDREEINQKYNDFVEKVTQNPQVLGARGAIEYPSLYSDIQTSFSDLIKASNNSKANQAYYKTLTDPTIKNAGLLHSVNNELIDQFGKYKSIDERFDNITAPIIDPANTLQSKPTLLKEITEKSTTGSEIETDEIDTDRGSYVTTIYKNVDPEQFSKNVLLLMGDDYRKVYSANVTLGKIDPKTTTFEQWATSEISQLAPSKYILSSKQYKNQEELTKSKEKIESAKNATKLTISRETNKSREKIASQKIQADKEKQIISEQGKNTRAKLDIQSKNAMLNTKLEFTKKYGKTLQQLDDKFIDEYEQSDRSKIEEEIKANLSETYELDNTGIKGSRINPKLWGNIKGNANTKDDEITDAFIITDNNNVQTLSVTYKNAKTNKYYVTPMTTYDFYNEVAKSLNIDTKKITPKDINPISNEPININLSGKRVPKKGVTVTPNKGSTQQKNTISVDPNKIKSTWGSIFTNQK